MSHFRDCVAMCGKWRSGKVESGKVENVWRSTFTKKWVKREIQALFDFEVRDQFNSTQGEKNSEIENSME